MPDRRGRLRLGVLFGGRSGEHEVSVVSAQNFMAAADRDRFDVVPIGITRRGAWLTPKETQAQLERPDKPYEKTLSLDDDDSFLGRADVLAVLRDVDVVFPIVHGLNGEDGTLQGLLELARVPYVGAGVAASAVGLDKALMKAAFLQAGLPTPDYIVAVETLWFRDPRSVIEGIEQRIGFPCFVKPANGGSSVGITKAGSREEIGEALNASFRYDRKALVEQAVSGREVECAVLGNDSPQASPIGEIVSGREFYDYEAKYLDATTQLIAPAELEPDTARTIQQMSIRAFQAIDCAGLARVDFFLTPEGELSITEINTLPGFTPISMYPRLWDLAGVSYTELITRLVDLGLERFREKEKLA